MAITAVVGFSEPFVQTKPFYDKSYVPVYRRTANNGAGTGSATVSQVVTQFRLSQLTDFSFPYRFGGRFYLGFATVQRSAFGSGVGTETATGFKSKTSTATGSGVGAAVVVGSVTPVRTASGSGVGTQTGTFIRGLIRSATGSGVGASSAVGLLSVIRNGQSSAGTGSSTISQVLSNVRFATGSGAGSSTAVGLYTAVRTAPGSGSGASVVVSVTTVIRSASSSGAGSSTADGSRAHLRSASGSGQGADVFADWMKSHIFRVPYTYNYPGGHYRDSDSANRLQRYNRTGVRARNLYKLTNGDYTTVEQRDLGQVAKLWYGGRDNFLNDAEVAELTAAGFGDSIT